MLLSLPVSANPGSSLPIALQLMQPVTGNVPLHVILYQSLTFVRPRRPICPQPKGKTAEEELFTFSGTEPSMPNLKQIESECLNLNITCPGGLTRESRLPVMVWIHGCVHPHCSLCSGSLTSPIIIVEAIAALDLIGSTMEVPSCRIVSG